MTTVHPGDVVQSFAHLAPADAPQAFAHLAPAEAAGRAVVAELLKECP